MVGLSSNRYPMTRSPLTVTLLPLVPLVALAWPLSRVTHASVDLAPPPPPENVSGPLLIADLSVQSAHPFQSLSVTIQEATWTFEPDEDIKEVHFPEGKEVILTVSIVWPDDTPETATQILLEPEGRPGRFHTIWGLGEVTEEISFTWEDPS